MKFCIETYGCAANQAESEIMAGLLREAGHEQTAEEEADIVIVNSCHVKQVTEQKILDRISKVKKKLIVAGCMPEAYRDKVMKANPNAVLLGTHRIFNIVESVEKGKGFTGTYGKEKLGLPRVRQDKKVAIIEISDGCLGKCSFCSTRLAKGNLFSYRPSSIIKEICNALEEGCKEIWITSQDTGAYGLDRGTNLISLLRKLPEGDYKVRIGMMNPNHALPLLKDLIEIYKDEKIMKFLHIPVQSGNNQILSDMNRQYTAEQFEHVVKEFRKAFPEIKIWTDVIVGYPGETEEQFKETIKLLKKIRPAKVNISRYAKRTGTPAARLKQLPTDEMKRRTKIITNLASSF